jgi:hypothetical protein
VQLSQNPLLQEFTQQLGQLIGLINRVARARLPGPRSTRREWLPPEFTAALQDRLLILSGRISFVKSENGSAEGLSTDDMQATGSSEGAQAPSIPLHQLCYLVGHVVELLAAPVRLYPSVEQLAGDGGAGFLEPIEQLLSVPDALQVVVQLGLSEAVREAAAEGDPPAMSCVRSICCMFRRIAFTLQMKDLTQVLGSQGSNQKLEEATRHLQAFLLNEGNLPFLEPLCLPPDHSEPHAPDRAVAYPHVQTCCRLPTASPTPSLYPPAVGTQCLMLKSSMLWKYVLAIDNQHACMSLLPTWFIMTHLCLARQGLP